MRDSVNVERLKDERIKTWKDESAKKSTGKKIGFVFIESVFWCLQKQLGEEERSPRVEYR